MRLEPGPAGLPPGGGQAREHPAPYPVAGALAYSHYNLLVRFIMKRIARSAGADTDTSHDYEYTDWADLDRFTADRAREIETSRDPISTWPASGHVMALR